MTESPALELRGVTVSYGEHVALTSIHLDVAPGSVVAIIGPSGCGKSTLLRAIAGLEPLTEGVIELDGVDLDGVATHRRHLGLMFQEHALFPHMTVGDNVAFGLTMSGASDLERSERVRDVLGLVGLDGFDERSVDALSGGEAQRVALARALAPSPRLLMLDEPLGSLDRLLREQLTADLRAVFASAGVTAIHVTHDQAEAFALADHVVILRDGRIEQQGPPVELWRRPTSIFVAEFLGHPNIWEIDGMPVMVPVTAIGLDPDGEIVATVRDVEFREGRFRVTANQTILVHERTLVFDTDVAPGLGDVVRLSVDGSQIAPLAASD